MKQTIIVFACILITAQLAFSAGPRTMSYQGVLVDNQGVVVPDGTYSMTFRLYTVESGGTHIWQETQSVGVEGGRFNVVLGSSSSLSGLAFNAPYWLGVKVGSDSEMTPRVELTGAPYTMSARTVEDGAITAGKVANNTVVRSLNGLKDDVELLEGANVTITPVGNDLQIASTGAGSDGDWTVDGSNMYAAVSGLIGIGTTAPQVALHIRKPGYTYVRVDATTTTGIAALTLHNSDDVDFSLAKYSPEVGGSHYGVPLANLNLISAFGGPIMISSGYGTPIHFATGGERMRITGTGNVEFYRSGVSTRVAAITNDSYGGRVEIKDELNNNIGSLIPDNSGSGGRLLLNRDDLNTGFDLNGNWASSGNPNFLMYGSTSSAEINLDSTGDDAVVLPIDAIGSEEISNEVGVANDKEQTGGNMPQLSYTTLLTRSITAPTNGYALVIATGEVVIGLGEGEDYTAAEFGVSAGAGIPVGAGLTLQMPPGIWGSMVLPVTVHGLFEVTAGTNTFYFKGFAMSQNTGGGWTVMDRQMTVVFIPTNYGDVEPTALTAGIEPTVVNFTSGPPITEPDVAAERAASEAANLARMQREMDEMRERLRRLEEERARENG